MSHVCHSKLLKKTQGCVRECREAGRVEGDRIRQQAVEEAEQLKQKAGPPSFLSFFLSFFLSYIPCLTSIMHVSLH